MWIFADFQGKKSAICDTLILVPIPVMSIPYPPNLKPALGLANLLLSRKQKKSKLVEPLEPHCYWGWHILDLDWNMKATTKNTATECMVTPNIASGSKNSNVGVIIAIKIPSENDLRAAKWKPAHHLKDKAHCFIKIYQSPWILIRVLK